MKEPGSCRTSCGKKRPPLLTNDVTTPERDSSPPELAVRIQIDDPTRLDALRDYFLRLGATAGVNADATLDVRFREDDHDVDTRAYLRTWSATNRVAATTAAPHTAAVAAVPVKPEVGPRGASPFDPPVRLGDLMVSKGFITVD